MIKLYFALIIASILSCGPATNKKAIPGLAPVDVYLNMEQRGFETKKFLMGKVDGNLWENHRNVGGLNYHVVTSSSDVSSVEVVKASSDTSPPNEIEEAKQFFRFISSLLYMRVVILLLPGTG